jgi:NTE family protein
MPRLRVALALGSGGLKGLAHIGVLRALAEAEIRPVAYAGASAGSLVAAAAAHDIPLADLRRLADGLLRRPMFQVDYVNLLRHGLRTPALYRSGPLRALCDDLFADVTFRDLGAPLVVSTVDVETSRPVRLDASTAPTARVADAVYASCALPGLLPPGSVDGRLLMDGSVLDPLALGAVARSADLVIVVSLDRSASRATSVVVRIAAPGLWWHAQAMVMRNVSRYELAFWSGAPLLVVRPDLREVHMVRGGDPARAIEAGYEAARAALERWEDRAVRTGGGAAEDIQ